MQPDNCNQADAWASKKMPLPFQADARANPKTTLALSIAAGALFGGAKWALLGGGLGAVLVGLAGLKKLASSPFGAEEASKDPFDFALFGQDDGSAPDDAASQYGSYAASDGGDQGAFQESFVDDGSADDSNITDDSYTPGAGGMADTGSGDTFTRGDDLPDDAGDSVWETSDDDPEAEYDEGDDGSEGGGYGAADGSYDGGGGGGSGGGSGSSGGGGSSDAGAAAGPMTAPMTGNVVAGGPGGGPLPPTPAAADPLAAARTAASQSRVNAIRHKNLGAAAPPVTASAASLAESAAVAAGNTARLASPLLRPGDVPAVVQSLAPAVAPGRGRPRMGQTPARPAPTPPAPRRVATTQRARAQDVPAVMRRLY